MDPIALFFFLGLAAGLLRTDLRMPASVYEAVTMLLLLSIGLKGGAELAKQAVGPLVLEMTAVVAMGVALTFMAFALLRAAGRFRRPDAAGIAAHYGSVSVGTYAVAVDYLTRAGVAFEAYVAVFATILEIPAIIVGVYLAKGRRSEVRWRQVAHEVFLGKSIVLLFGGLFIGWLAGPGGLRPIEPLFVDLFSGILALFLLEMGLFSAGQVGSLRRGGAFLVVFAIVMPLIGSVAGGLLGWALGLNVGGTMLLATLAASASYIAAPAAMRLTVPEANPALSLGASLGITFPFNIVLGIFVYHRLAEIIHEIGG